MTPKFTGLAAAVLALMASFIAPASAATVDAQNAVAFEFDLSTAGAINLNRFGYNCGACASEDRLLSGATMQIDFGSTLGAADIGTSTFANPFNFAISNVSAGLGGGVPVAGSVDSLFVTFRFVDDAFGVSSATLYHPSTGVLVGTFAGSVPASPVSPVPLPAGMVLMVSGLGGLAFLKRRKAARATTG